MLFDNVKFADGEMERLAKAIARAQLTAADEMVAEQTANWPQDFVHELESKTVKATQAQRFEVFRQLAPRAAQAIEKEAADKAAAAARMAQIVAERKEREAKQIESNTAENAARMARWQADAHAAKQAGRNEPPRPQLLPVTGEDILLANAMERTRSNF